MTPDLRFFRLDERQRLRDLEGARHPAARAVDGTEHRIDQPFVDLALETGRLARLQHVRQYPARRERRRPDRVGGEGLVAGRVVHDHPVHRRSEAHLVEDFLHVLVLHVAQRVLEREAEGDGVRLGLGPGRRCQRVFPVGERPDGIGHHDGGDRGQQREGADVCPGQASRPTAPVRRGLVAHVVSQHGRPRTGSSTVSPPGRVSGP